MAVILSSLLAAGSLSLFNVARLLYAVPTLLFGATIGQAALPTLSLLVATKDWDNFRKTLLDACLQVIFLALPVCILFIVLRIPIVRLVFGAKTFPWEATLLTGKTLAILMVSAGFYAIMQLIIRAFYALHDTKTPLLVGFGAAVFNTIFGILAVKVWNWGIAGIALSLSLTAIMETIILVIILIKKVFPQKDSLFESLHILGKIVGISVVMGLGLWIPMRLLDQFIFDTTRTIDLLVLTLITSIIGMALYISLSWIIRIPQLTYVKEIAFKLGDWRKYLKAPAQSEPIIMPTAEQN